MRRKIYSILMILGSGLSILLFQNFSNVRQDVGKVTFSSNGILSNSLGSANIYNFGKIAVNTASIDSNFGVCANDLPGAVNV